MRKYVSCRLMLAVLAVLFVVTASPAAAVQVTPSNMQGWVLATVTSGNALFTPGPLGNLTGPGALWLYCGGDGSTSVPPYPGQIWMGTNAYDETRLEAITELSYDSWTSNSGIYKSGGGSWYDRWSGPRQQCGLRLFIDPQDATARRVLFYRPRGNDYAPYVDDMLYENAWVHNDCLDTGYWDVLDPSLTTGQFTHYSQSWGAILGLFPNGKIVQPALEPAAGEWPEVNPPNSPNACGISLEWGAEMYGLNDKPNVPWKNWWRETVNGIGWVDNVVIAVDYSGTVYDFEPDSIEVTVTGNATAMQSQVSYKSCRQRFFVPYGRVAARVTQSRFEEFCLDDGSPTATRVHCPSNPNPTLGQWTRVYGLLVPGYSNRWYNTDPIPNRFHTDIYDNHILNVGP